MRMQLETGEVRHPHEGGGVARHDFLGGASGRKAQGDDLDPWRARIGRAFLIEELAVDPVRDSGPGPSAVRARRAVRRRRPPGSSVRDPVWYSPLEERAPCAGSKSSRRVRRRSRFRARLDAPSDRRPVRLHFAQPAFEKATLGVVGRERNGSGVGSRRICRASEPAQQIRARGVKQVIPVEIALGGERVDERERGPAPSTIAIATARFSATIGEGCTRSSRLVEPRDLRPVGLFGRARPGSAAPRSRPAARTDRVRRAAPLRPAAAPRRSGRWFHRLRSCSSSRRDRRPRRAARRAANRAAASARRARSLPPAAGVISARTSRPRRIASAAEIASAPAARRASPRSLR